MSFIQRYSLASDGEKFLSKNFQVKEFRCKDGTDTIYISSELVKRLQMIRDFYKVPVRINSGYRTVAYNRKVGGATHSYHVRGMAADITIDGIKPGMLRMQLNSYDNTIFGTRYNGGVGAYPTFTHIDVGPNRRWNG